MYELPWDSIENVKPMNLSVLIVAAYASKYVNK